MKQTHSTSLSMPAIWTILVSCFTAPAVAEVPQPASMNQRLAHTTPRSARQQDLMNSYYSSLVDWGRIVASRVQPVPDRAGELYIGRGGNVENDVRPTAYAAMVLSFLAETQHSPQLLTAEERRQMRNQSIGLLRYLTRSHVSGGGMCANGKPWGNVWQSAMWTRAAGMAAWQSWNSLDEELRTSVAQMICLEADRFLQEKPKSSVRDDTGAEENAWNASITAIACNMFPNHQHARDWETASKKYTYNTFSVTTDATSDTIGDDGQRIRDWVDTVNAHDDFAVENHGLVHVGYLKNTLTMQLENEVHWKMVDRELPLAGQHHAPEVFDILCRCMNWNAAAIYFGGNDWQIYETQCSDILIYTALRQLHGNRHAALLEDTALKHLIRRQRAEGGYYNGRRDLEYGGMCATRLMMCFWLHALSDELTPPVTQQEFNAKANGVTKLESARTVMHRTADKFASFTWAQKRMALAIPSRDSSVVWPHFTSYTGVINAEHSSDQFCTLQNLRVDTEDNAFSVSGTLVRCKNTLRHDFYYASPTGAFTVYVERLRPQKGFQLQYRKTGIIGLDYPVGGNERPLFGAFGSLIAKGMDSPKQNTPLRSNWLNIDNQIGFVVCRDNHNDNNMLYHDKNQLDPRRPHLQESIALIHDDSGQSIGDSSWSCVVTFLNQTAEDTQSMIEHVRLTTNQHSATLKVRDEVFQIAFGEE